MLNVAENVEDNKSDKFSRNYAFSVCFFQICKTYELFLSFPINSNPKNLKCQQFKLHFQQSFSFFI